MEAEAFKIIITAATTGAISTFATVSALRVHINYLRESLQRHEAAISRAHDRIDHIERAKP
ncbi:coil containing protein [Vibrio phage 1.249.A._10N.261.55.B9]|uniref:Coil containing protein n=2 Tax=Autolykiviridae TaxID=2184034 RepID=A0A2I7RXH1_9VIRU|nr:coil containing protein [Vibrio phage 1.249.A._10N.261.55.B9]AUR98315.1 coil containing protein [Vibrio phage 1.249.A._10N.261.55.B9]AUR98337.1 coil containing protein [Vibrio phage 1.249.B._10N.261.55.B9]